MTIDKKPEDQVEGPENPERPFADELDKVWEKLLTGKRDEEEDDALREEEGEQEEEGREEGEVEVSEKDTAEEESEEEDSESIEPLEQWPDSVKERFNDLSKEDQLWMIDTYKSFQSDYTKKTQEISGIKKALDPLRAEMEELGVDEATAITNLAAAHMGLKEVPYQTLKFLFQAYEADIDTLREHWENPQEADQAINPQKKEEKRKEQEARTKQAKEAAAQGEKKWKAFAKENEYAETLRPVMIALAQADYHQGKDVSSLDELYERAMWVNPDTRQIAIKNAENGDLADRLEKRKNSVTKAKNASKSVKRGSVTSEPEPEKPKSMRDEMSILYDKLSETSN